MSVSGKPYKLRYQRFVDEIGNVRFKVVGKIDTQSEIDSHRLDCDVNYLVERFAQGDVSALNRCSGFYGDFSNVPKSYADMINMVHQAEDAFNHLPAKLRDQFDGSFEKFFSTLGSEETSKIINDFYSPAPQASVDEKVGVSDES